MELSDYCKYCGIPLRKVMLGGLICLCGGRCSNDPNYCEESPTHEHSFVKPEPERD